MKLSAQSHLSIVNAVKKALGGYFSEEEKNVVTDIHLQPVLETGELVIYNDEEEVLSQAVIKDWVECNPEEFYLSIESTLKEILGQLREEGLFNKLNIMRPYSMVLIDEEKETVAELLLIDDDETLFINDELLKGLDEELNLFLKNLLEN